MKKKNKTIKWKVLIGYISMILPFLLIGVIFLIDKYFLEGFGVVFVIFILSCLFWLIYSIYLLIKPEFRFHGKVLFGLWILFFVLGFLIYFYYSYPKPKNTKEECRVRMVSWCATCKAANWMGGPKIGEGLTRCSMYFKIDWTADTDCSVSDAKEVCSMFIPF